MGAKPPTSRGSRQTRSRSVAGLAAAGAMLVFANAGARADDGSSEQSLDTLRQMSIEQLGNIAVTSVSKEAEPLSDAAAAIYVITHDEIMRSGATYLPEILRLAPNLEIAASNSDFYAVSARGFNGTTANKLLVLIDGRSIYTPLYSGVFWDVQGLMPEDIDRIEVISGPGAALWGPNAVNGVINIITRDAHDTQGGVVSVLPGSFENSVRARYGGMWGENTAWRIYGTGLFRDNTVKANGVALKDSWDNVQGGFRIDWGEGGDAVTLQGDINEAHFNQKVPADQHLNGRDILGRWTHNFADGSQIQLQAYYDYSRRFIQGYTGDTVRVYDFEFQHDFSWGEDQNIVWGASYRASKDTFLNPPVGGYLVPDSRSLYVAEAFVQDTVSLADQLDLTAGLKVEDNTYTGAQPMPSVRLSWKPSADAMLWAAASRAVRTPSRFDRDVYQKSGSTIIFNGGQDFDDEKLTAYEAGYRGELFDAATLSVSAYYNDYDELRSVEVSPTGTIPLSGNGHSGYYPAYFGNKMHGRTYGVEIWGTYDLTAWWRLTAGYNAMREHLRFRADSLDVAGTQAIGDDPKYQVSLRSSMSLPDGFALELALRNIGALPNPAVPSYTELDAHLGWKISGALELSLAGFNLLHKRHPEFGPVASRGELERNVTAGVRWTF